MPSINEVQAALVRALNAQPPAGECLALSPDSSKLASVFGEMAYFREDARDLSLFTPSQQEAYQRWA